MIDDQADLHKFKCESNLYINSDQLFLEACSNGNLNLAQSLYGIMNIHINKNESFLNACKYGHIEIAKWLYQMNIDVDIMNDAFSMVCWQNHLDLAIWMKEIGVDIHANDERAFRWACSAENMEIIIWLYQFDIKLIYFEKIPTKKILYNIFKLNKINVKFFKGAMIGCLKTIKEAIEEGAEYDILNDYAFNKNCCENKIALVEYLASLDPKYYYEISNYKIINYMVNRISKNARNGY